MGSDPRRLDGLRQDERFAALLLERATGGTVRAHDVGGRQGAYDLDLTLPDGRTAAVEVTTHAGPARRGTALLGPQRLPRATPARRWHAPGHDGDDSGSRGRTASARDAFLRELPRAVSDLLTVPHVARRAAKVATVRAVDERHLLVGIGEGGLPDAVYLPLAGGLGPLTGPLDALPTDPPEVPDGLTHVWLTTARPGAPLLGWSRAHGWGAHPT